MIEKMEFLRITGPKEDIDRVNEKYLMKYDMHMENAMTELSDVINIKPYVEVNPHKEILAKAENLMKMLEITEPAKEKEITLEEAIQITEEAYQKVEEINKEKENLENKKKHLEKLQIQKTWFFIQIKAGHTR